MFYILNAYDTHRKRVTDDEGRQKTKKKAEARQYAPLEQEQQTKQAEEGESRQRSGERGE
jgi:hypothetical protein